VLQVVFADSNFAISSQFSWWTPTIGNDIDVDCYRLLSRGRGSISAVDHSGLASSALTLLTLASARGTVLSVDVLSCQAYDSLSPNPGSTSAARLPN
jgi:hypothetical protein